MFRGCAIGCGALFGMALLVVGAGFFWFRATFGRPMPATPTLPNKVALRPIFLPKSGGRPYSAGTAVAVRAAPEGAPILLTALHLFGPAGGMKANLAPGKIDDEIREVWLMPISTKKLSGRARGSLIRNGAPLSPADPSVARDAAAFDILKGASVDVLPLANSLPDRGDWVWLVGDIVDHQPQSQRLFPGQVLNVTRGTLLLRMKERFQATAFSGAPVINERQEVVAILIGGDDQKGILVANSAVNIRTLLGSR